METSLFNFYVDERMGDDHKNTVKLFEEIASGKYDAYSSAYVIDELEKAQPEKRDRMLSIFAKYDVKILEPDVMTNKLAGAYVSEGIIPEKYRTDGMHIAIATVNGLDIIISMNFRHIVKRKTIKMTGAVNILNGYKAVEIYSPAEVIEDEGS